MEKSINNKKAIINRRKNGVLLLGLACLAVLATAVVIFASSPSSEPTASSEQELLASVTLETPAPVASTSREEIVIDVVVNELPDREYPAASLSIHFDNDRLEFVGVRHGTMVTRGPGGDYSVPAWSNDVTAANEYGIINIMYLDLTAGEHPYVITDEDLLLSLVFRLTDGLQSGDVLHVTLEDAVFATLDEAYSVTMMDGHLRGFNAQIIVE